MRFENKIWIETKTEMRRAQEEWFEGEFLGGYIPLLCLRRSTASIHSCLGFTV